MSLQAPERELLDPLRRLFGFDRFLPGQEEIVRRSLAGRDTLALMPTGSGKSLPYQLAAMLRPSPTLVVSPLIALMKDQVDKLPPEVAERASLINSSLEPDEAAGRLRAFAEGGIKLLYAAPERLRQRPFVSALAAAGVGLVVVDEVHCVTMWGHDFRPDYLFIRAALDELGQPPLLGLTATATPDTEREIGASLGRDFDVVRASVVRPNLRHAADHVEDEEERRRALLARLEAAKGPAIVYARSRKKCEQVARMLQGHRISAAHYHAGMESAARSETQERFIAGDLDVVVATTAFGMGIDKPDIRLVLLYNFPGSLEDYVQMVGRAGRDGAESACVLFAGDRDAAALRRFAQDDVPPLGVLRDVYRLLRERASGGVARVAAEELLSPEDDDARVLVGMLEQAGLVRRTFDEGRRMSVELLAPPADAAERMDELLDRYARSAIQRVTRIIRYAGSSECRQREIAEHFGEELADACGTCDRCDRPRSSGVAAFADDVSALPADIPGAILRAVERLRWPLGQTGLAAMLSGSVAAPPSARRSPDFGALAAATPSAVKREVRRLVDSGHIETYESPEGYRLLRRGALPAPEPRTEAPPDERLLERLKAWRLETARAEGRPAFAVFPDRALREIASARPSDESELAGVHGVGPAKLERYGAAVLDLVGASEG